MKRQTEQLLERLFLGWLIIGVIGLVISVTGLLIKSDSLYFIGLIVAVPVYLFGLGLALLIVLMYILGIGHIVRWIYRKLTGTTPQKDSRN